MAGTASEGIDRRALAAALNTDVVWASAFVGTRDLLGEFSRLARSPRPAERRGDAR